MKPEDGSAMSWMRLLMRNRVVVAIMVIAALGLLAFVGFNSGDAAEPTEFATGTTAAPSSSGTTEEIVGHQIPPIDGCTLISDAEIYAALELPENIGVFRFSGGEGCVWRPGDEEDAFANHAVELSPGDPTDFEPSKRINDTSAVDVPSLGDHAVWFGGDDAGTLSAIQQTEIGYLFLKLTFSQPDLTDSERLERATRLVTSAIDEIRFGPPKPVEADLCELVTDAEAEQLLAPHREGRAAARDSLFVTDNFSDPVDLTQPGEYSCAKLILAEIYVKVESAQESDFGVEASIDDVVGEPLTGIGDVAVWFEDVPYRSSFSAQHSIDVLSVRWGDASFRIVLALPDMAPDEQFDTAKGLAMQALGRLPGGPGQVTFVERDVPDLSNHGFVENLLAKEVAGDWSRAEGLIATLGFFAGETNAEDVLNHPELLDYSGTGIISLAQEYVETAPNELASQELTRLLGVLVPDLGPKESQDVASGLTVALGGFIHTGPIAQGEEDDGGYAPPPEDEGDGGYAPPPEDDDAGFDYPEFEFDPVPGECANQTPSVAGWVPSGYEVADLGPWTGAVLFPEEGLTGGWNRETHLLWALEALTDSIAEYGAPPLCIRMLFSHHGGSYTYVVEANGMCGIFINRPMQNRKDGHFKQQLAADIAHCYFPYVFPNQFGVSYSDRRWWNHALAEYLSNVVYPSGACSGSRCDLEWRLSASMASQETSKSLVDRAAANWIFFQQTEQEVGEEGVATLIRALPGGNDTYADERALADLAGMNAFFHKFSQLMTDAAVEDTGGGHIPYDPDQADIPISGKGIHIDEPIPFLVTRWHLIIDPGMYACMSSQKSENVLASYRPGSAGAGTSGGWQELPEEETPFTDDLVIVATTVRDSEQFSIDVRDVHEEEDCEDEPEEPQLPEPPEQCQCDPSDYFLVWQEIPELLQQIFNPSNQ